MTGKILQANKKLILGSRMKENRICSALKHRTEQSTKKIQTKNKARAQRDPFYFIPA